MHLQTHPEDVSLHELKLGKIAIVTQKKWKLLILLLYFYDFFFKGSGFDKKQGFPTVVGGRIIQAFGGLFCSPQKRTSLTKVSA